MIREQLGKPQTIETDGAECYETPPSSASMTISKCSALAASSERLAKVMSERLGPVMTQAHPANRCGEQEGEMPPLFNEINAHLNRVEEALIDIDSMLGRVDI